jgi:hypothetical protein
MAVSKILLCGMIRRGDQMPSAKRTFTIPNDVILDFEREVPSGKRSTVVAEIIRDWLERRRLYELRREVVEGCREMELEYDSIEKEFHPLEEELEREIGDTPPTR